MAANVPEEPLVHERIDKAAVPPFRVPDTIRNLTGKASHTARMSGASPPAISFLSERL